MKNLPEEAAVMFNKNVSAPVFHQVKGKDIKGDDFGIFHWLPDFIETFLVL